MLGRPLIALLFQRGAFDAQSTDAVYYARVGQCPFQRVVTARQCVMKHLFRGLKDLEPPRIEPCEFGATIHGV